MTFRYRLQYNLVRLLRCSNKEAKQYILQGFVNLNGETVLDPLQIISAEDELSVHHKIIRQKKIVEYILFHKPHGYECTHNLDVTDNIFILIPQEYRAYPIFGRLDKNSEGLLLLSNDGKIYNHITKGGGEIDKEYHVCLKNPITDSLIQAFEQGIQLGQRTSLPALFHKINDYECTIILREGINRQIRRICAKNHNQVLRLIRTRIGDFCLDDLEIGHWKKVFKTGLSPI